MSLRPILQILKIIETISRFPASSETIGRQFDISPATVKRHVVEARQIGADIRSVRLGGGWVYELRNPEVVMARVKLWIDLEEKRDLTA